MLPCSAWEDFLAASKALCGDSLYLLTRWMQCLQLCGMLMQEMGFSRRGKLYAALAWSRCGLQSASDTCRQCSHQRSRADSGCCRRHCRGLRYCCISASLEDALPPGHLCHGSAAA
jgi:hypothetical protein